MVILNFNLKFKVHILLKFQQDIQPRVIVCFPNVHHTNNMAVYMASFNVFCCTRVILMRGQVQTATQALFRSVDTSHRIYHCMVLLGTWSSWVGVEACDTKLHQNKGQGGCSHAVETV